MNNKQLIRQNFRDAVFKRDKYTCRVCNQGDPTKGMGLDGHHITDRNEMPNGGYVASNGISLCFGCHIKAEHYHGTQGKAWEEGFHPRDLYNLIGSSFTKAYDDSAGLNRRR